MTTPPPAGPPSDDGFGSPTYSDGATASASAPVSNPSASQTPTGPDLTKQDPPPPAYSPAPPTAAPAGPPPQQPPSSVYDTSAPWNAYGANNSPRASIMQSTVPPVAWLAPVAALLAVIGLFTPWFKPNADLSFNGRTEHLTGDTLHAWEDGKIGLLAPIVLVVLAVGIVRLLLGHTPARFSRGSASPITQAARGMIIAGVVAAVCLTIAFFLIQTQYKIDIGNGKQSWSDAKDYAKSHGATLDIAHGPQIGYWLTIAAAAVAIIAGILMLVIKGKESETAPLSAPGGPPAYGTPGAPGMPPAYGQQNQPYAQNQPYGQQSQPSGGPSYASPPNAPGSPYGPPSGQPQGPPQGQAQWSPQGQSSSNNQPQWGPPGSQTPPPPPYSG